MTVSQRTLFIGQDNRLDSNPDTINYFGVWTSDGATASEATQLTGPSDPTQPGLSNISTAAALPGLLVFAIGRDPSGPLFATDPTTGLPVELSVPSLPTTDTPMDATSIGSVVLFSAQDSSGADDLWRTDGTAAGTFALAIPAGLTVPGGGGLNPASITAFNGGALFAGFGADGAYDLFFTNGTSAGTREVTTLASSHTVLSANGDFQPLGVLNGRLIFTAPDADGSTNLLATDGSTAGTTAFSTSPDYGSRIVSALVGDRVFFSGGSGLYVTDGSAAGTSLVSDFGLTASDYNATLYAYPTEIVALGSLAVMTVLSGSGYGGVPGSDDLVVSDGTAAGTTSIDPDVPLNDNYYGAGFNPFDLTVFGSEVLLSATDTLASSTPGTYSAGLWITDGTAAGTVEIAPGVNPSSIVVLANGLAEFSGTDGLYVTDGTAAGTHLIAAAGAAADGLAPATIYAVPSPLGFTGAQAQYDLAPNAAGELQARDLVAGRDGSIVAPDARVLDFGDGSTAVFDATGNAEAVARLYLAAYNRAPDPAGLLSYTRQADAGTISLAQIAAAAPTSPQFLSTYGALSNVQFVTQLYENADGRAPDPGGLAAYTGALADGQMRGQVLLAIAESPEARLHGVAVAGDANDATVTRLYEAINARAPDPGGQITYASALDNGQSVQQIAAAMLAGPEYAAEFGSPGNAAFVTELYANLLGRAPDPGGLASYTADLAGGQSRAQLVAGFVGSDEARLVTAPLTHQGYVSVI